MNVWCAAGKNPEGGVELEELGEVGGSLVTSGRRREGVGTATEAPRSSVHLEDFVFVFPNENSAFFKVGVQ